MNENALRDEDYQTVRWPVQEVRTNRIQNIILLIIITIIIICIETKLCITIGKIIIHGWFSNTLANIVITVNSDH